MQSASFQRPIPEVRSPYFVLRFGGMSGMSPLCGSRIDPLLDPNPGLLANVCSLQMPRWTCPLSGVKTKLGFLHGSMPSSPKIGLTFGMWRPDYQDVPGFDSSLSACKIFDSQRMSTFVPQLMDSCWLNPILCWFTPNALNMCMCCLNCHKWSQFNI